MDDLKDLQDKVLTELRSACKYPFDVEKSLAEPRPDYKEAHHYALQLQLSASALMNYIKKMQKLDDRPQGEDEDGTL